MLLACSYTIPAIQNLPGQSGGGSSDTESLIWEIDTTINGSTPNTQFRLQSNSLYTTNYDVDWGDGNSDTGVTSTNFTHTYPSPGIYEIKIRGDFNSFYSYGDAQKITKVKQWGKLNYKSMRQAYRGCRYLEVTAEDSPDLSSVQNMTYMFYGCQYNFVNSNQSLLNWDTSNVTSMNGTFYACWEFNQAIPQNWDFSSLVDNGLSYIFFNCYKLDQDISQMNVTWSNINQLTAPIGKAGKNSATKYNICNYDISNWDVSNIIAFRGWSTGQTTGDSSLADKQPLSIGMDQWDLSGLGTYAAQGFSNAELASFFMDMKENTNGVGCTWNDIVTGWASYINPTNVDKLDYSNLFYAATFNEDLSPWDFSNGVAFRGMFQRNDYYNQPFTGWNLSSLGSQSMNNFQAYQTMFRDANNFDQPLGDLNIGAPPSNAWNGMFSGILRNESISTANYDATLIAWNNQINALPAAEQPQNCTINMGSSTYTIGSAADTARANLISTHGWSFTDGGGV